QTQADHQVRQDVGDRRHRQDLDRKAQRLHVDSIRQDETRSSRQSLPNAVEEAQADEKRQRKLCRTLVDVVPEASVEDNSEHERKNRQKNERRDDRPRNSKNGIAMNSVKLS